MKTFLRSALFKQIALFALLFTSCLSTFYAVYLMFPFISFEGRGVLTFLPTVLIYFYPIFSFAFLYAYVHRRNTASKWRVAYYYSITAGIINLLCLIWHIISICLTLGWKLYGGISVLYPFDVLAFLLIAFGISLFIFIRCLIHREDAKAEITNPEVISKGMPWKVAFFVGAAAYFEGAALNSLMVIGDGYFDTNLIFMIPVLIAFMMPMISFMLFMVFNHLPEGSKKKMFLISLIILGSLFIVLLGWILAGYMVSPYFVPHSMSGLFPFGYAIKLPLGLLIIGLMELIVIIVALVKFIKKYK